MASAGKAGRRPRVIELRLVRGSIVDADARALVLGVFSNVDPSGAAGAIDARLGGAIREFTQRRMFRAQLGQVFVLPCPPGALRAGFVLFAGLGDFDVYGGRAGAFVAENVVRTLARSGIDDFATVLLGGGSGLGIAAALEPQLRGVLDGLRHADPGRVLRRVTLCEIDARRFAALARAAHRLAPRLSGDGLELRLRIVERPPSRRTAPGARPAVPRTREVDPCYLLVSLRDAGRSGYEARASLLTAGAKAAVLSGTTTFTQRELQRVLRPVEDGSAAAGDLPRLGRGLAQLLLARSVHDGLATMSHRPLVIVHDREASRVPWETLHVGDGHPALGRGLSRRYEADGLSVARWREAREPGPRIRVLLVANPTEDLPGAAAEAQALRALLEEHGASPDVLSGRAATREAVLDRLAAGGCDVLHFAGHAFFDADDPGRSGLLCAGGRVLRGADLASITNLPALVFCNACEAARVRRRERRRAAQRSSGVAEAFLAGGVANFIGTHWPVGDAAALEFSIRLYRDLLAGTPLGEAVIAARRRVFALASIDWADYVHYGAPQFRLGNPDQEN